METKTLTIMFIDLAGFTLRTSRIPRDKFLELLNRYENIVEPVVSEFKGNIIKKIGDAFLAAFESPTNAVLCGIKIQDALFKYNQQAQKIYNLNVRIAINTGEVHLRDNDVYGEAVNIASRLEKTAKINDVYFTDSVYLSMNKAEIPSIFIGEKRFRGIPRMVKIYKVLGEYSRILLARKKRRRKTLGMIRMILFTILLIFILLFSAAAFYFYITLYNIKLF